MSILDRILHEELRHKIFIKKNVPSERGRKITIYPNTETHGEERANVALVDDLLNLCKAFNSKEASKIKVAMQKQIGLDHGQQYEGRYCIYDKLGEPIHIEGWSTASDGRETQIEAFE